jgi:hypothetical protein
VLDETATRPRRGRTFLAWFAANVVIGYILSFPLLTIVIFTYYIRAKLWGTVSSPFRDGEADVPFYFIIVTGLPLTVIAILANRALRRRLDLHGWQTAAFWVVTIAVVLAPATFFALGELTVPQMFGKGLFW